MSEFPRSSSRMPAPSTPEGEDQDRVRIWELSGAVPSEPDYWSGDRFVRKDGQRGVLVSRWIPDAEFARLLLEHSERMHLISDSRPSGAAPPLKLLR